MELKEQLKEELLKQKKEKQKLIIEQNSKLKEITLFIKPEHPICKNYIKYFTENGIKFKEKDISLHNEIVAIVQNNQVPVIFINDNYLVHGRDFQNPNQCINILQHLANPDFVNPSNDVKMIESIKNLNFNISKSMQNLNRQLQPIVQLLNSLREEEKEENKDAKKNN